MFANKKYSNEINGQKIFKRNNGRKKFKFQQREVSSHSHINKISYENKKSLIIVFNQCFKTFNYPMRQ